MHSLTKTFLRGLGIVLPIALTIYAVVWTAQTTEMLLKPLFVFLMPDRYYVPGSGFVLAIVLVYVAGLLMRLFVFEWLVRLGQRLLARTPLVKSIYNALNDFVSYVSRRPTEEVSRVVSIGLDHEMSLVGFITDNDPHQFQAAGDPPDRVAVYLPMSYQIGGFTVLLPRDRLKPLAMGVEEAMRLVLTAGVGRKAEPLPPRADPSSPVPPQRVM
jgi:uncharacterized membrane protein